ncbi:aminotransferase class III-fold pyridoxal phosphate-dependent enzyme [Actinomadura formosensis]|uniref:aminotransferase class III-fold pyridoxal phosphate-dependent enzyme n=1 Tax=Actinomadura formosensis TaxID=60706 RepID=UPI003D8BA4A5
MYSTDTAPGSEGTEGPLTPAEVARVLHDEYGLDVAEQKELGGEVDQNRWIRTSTGDEFLLKASMGDVDDAMRWQERVLAHLATDAPDLPVPRLIPATSGATLVPVVSGDGRYVARLLTWLPGTMIAELEEQPETLLTELGRVAARLTQSLGRLDSKPSQSHAWDLRTAHVVVDEALPFVEDGDDRELVARVMGWFERVRPRLAGLPAGVVHQDLNDFNVLVESGTERINGILDVADALHTARVTEVAVAVAYAMLRKADPLSAAAAVVRGFHSVAPLSEDEIAVIFPLAAARLCLNATVWTRRTSSSDHAYGRSRMQYTWPALRKVARIAPSFAEVSLRAACGFSTPRTLGEASPAGRPAVAEALIEVDLSPAGDLLDDVDWSDAGAVASVVDALLGDRTTRVGFTRHLAPSLLWSAQRATGPAEPATVQLGSALLARVGSAVGLPVAGEVVSVAGPAVLRHAAGAVTYWTSWWGVDVSHQPGDRLDAGDQLGTVAAPPEKPGLGAVVQVQVLATEDLAVAPPPRRVRVSEVPAWQVLTADPERFLGLPARAGGRRLDGEGVAALRDRRLARSQRAYYRRPPNFVRGRGVWLYDEYGRGYLDAINNVTHVGHANPRIVDVATAQMKKLNTNSRFLYEGIATYTERLVSTLPAPLEVVFLVCTGSEANDLALRMARQVTGRTDVMVIDGAYHGNTAAVMGISPNRYKGPGGRGAPPTTHEVVRPDVYRGPHGRGEPDAGRLYAADVAAVARRLVDEGRPPAAFIAESLMGTAGNIVFPDGYLRGAFEAVRAAGGLCISDEVQVGVGRLGSHFWGFQVQDVVPDIVTMGKPLGNGHPIAAVVTTREIADAFDDGVKYFNTFGGNPVSCAIGTTVLDIVQGDGLQERAAEVGAYFLQSLRDLKARHELIGDVRGRGLYLGVELVRNRDTLEPAAREAMAVSERIKDTGVVVYPTGAHDNVLKIKPPMIFGPEHVDIFTGALDQVLTRGRAEGWN